MSNLSYSNRSFQRTVKQVRKIMPVLAVILLIGVYAVSAITEGVFLSSLMADVSGGAWLSFAIATAIQATRALLVFFPQLNPNRPTFGHSGEIIAIIMGLVAIGSILGLVDAMELPTPVAVSLSVLMLAGIGVEIFFLKEIRYATELEIYADKEHWSELQNYHQAREEFKAFLDGLKDYDPTKKALPEPEVKQEPAATTPPAEKETGTIPAIVMEAIAAYQIKPEDLKKVLAMVEAGMEHYIILTAIKQLAKEKKLQAEEKDVATTPLDFSANGNGKY